MAKRCPTCRKTDCWHKRKHDGQLRGAAMQHERAKERDREILAMLESRTYAELATELGVAPDSVRGIVYRARRRLGVTVR